MLQPRLIDLERDFDEVSTWWVGYEKPVCPKELLPPIGFIIEGLCAAWLYRTDSPVVILEPMIGNPKADPTERAEAINALFECMIKCSKELGAQHILAVSSHPKLAAKGALHGFEEIARGQSLYHRKVS